MYIDNTVTDTYAELAALTDEDGKKIVKDQGTWVKAKLNGAAEDYIQIAAGALTIKEGDTFEFGYYKLTVDANVDGSAATAGAGSGEWSAALPDGADELYIKKEAQEITIKLTDTAASSGKVTVAAGNGKVISVDGKAGSALAKQDKDFTVDVVVELTAADITGDITDLALSLSDFVGDVSMTVTYNGETKTVSIPEDTASWLDVLKAAGWDNDYTARSGKVRLDSDWTKGEAVGTIGNDFKTAGKITDKLSVTFGCVEMGRTTDASDYDGAGAVTWTVNGGAMDVASTKTYFMVAGEEITVAIDLSKLTTAITNAKQKIALGGTVANVEASVTVTGLAAKKTTDSSVVDPAPTAVPGATGKDVSLGLGANEETTAGTVTFTITVGDTDTKDLTLKALA